MTSTSDPPTRSRLYQEHLSTPVLRGTRIQQYTLSRVLGTWAAAALPMAALAWLVAPWLASTMNGPTALPRALLACGRYHLTIRPGLRRSHRPRGPFSVRGGRRGLYIWGCMSTRRGGRCDGDDG